MIRRALERGKGVVEVASGSRGIRLTAAMSYAAPGWLPVRRTNALMAAGLALALSVWIAAVPEEAHAAAVEPFPTLQLAPSDVALTIDGIPYPRAVVEGYLGFSRRQAALAGDPRSFYEWGELLHLFDTATERVLAARAAWDSGFRVTPDDLTQFSRYTVDSTPTYLDELYGGSREIFTWDATLQILMKKWMVFIAHGVEDASWVEAGELMAADEVEFAAWDAWYGPALEQAQVVTYPERVERSGATPPRAGIVLLVAAAAGVLGLWLRGIGRGPRNDLLVRWGWLDALARRRIYPVGPQVVVVAVFVLMLGALAFGPSVAHRNLGSVYLWILWWPLVPFLLFFSARSWCAVCPIATLGDLVQRIPGFGSGRAPRHLTVAGIWIIEGTFVTVTWFDRSLGMVSSVGLTLIALLGLTGAALTTAALYGRRTFCRHVCFFGALAGNYSMASMIELRPDLSVCRGCRREACLRQAAAAGPDGCPMLERPRSLTSNRDCNLCLACLRTCDRRALALRVRDPLRELAEVRRPQLAVAGLAAILLGVVAVQNLGMLEVSGIMERRLMEATGLGRGALSSLLYLGALLLPLGLLAVAARGDRRRFAFYGYALIPLDLGAHAAHNLLHQLGEGRSVWWVTARLFGLASPLDIPGGHPGGSMGAALLDAPTIRVLQIMLLVLAATGSLVVARRMRRRLGAEVPFAGLYGLLLVLLGANLWLFSVPMALRH